MNKKKLFLLAGIAIFVGALFYFDLWQYLTLETIKSKQAVVAAFYAQNRLLCIAVYFCLYVLITALSLPVAALMTLLGGAIFGLIEGTIVVSFASTIGATLAFLACRYLFRDAVEQKFSGQLATINRGIEKDGAF